MHTQEKLKQRQTWMDTYDRIVNIIVQNGAIDVGIINEEELAAGVQSCLKRICSTQKSSPLLVFFLPRKRNSTCACCVCACI